MTDTCPVSPWTFGLRLSGWARWAKSPPPRAYYATLLDKTLAQMTDASFAVGMRPPALAMGVHFDGRQADQGYGPSRSIIACRQGTTVEPIKFGTGAADHRLQNRDGRLSLAKVAWSQALVQILEQT